MIIRIYKDGKIEMATGDNVLSNENFDEYPIEDGCGSHSCLIRKLRGQGVNGPCMCLSEIPRGYHIPIKKHLHDIGWPIVNEYVGIKRANLFI